jgi:hypothetical protein
MVIEWWQYVLAALVIFGTVYLLLSAIEQVIGNGILNGYKQIEEYKEKNAKTKP